MFEFVNLCYVCTLRGREVEAVKIDRGGYICEHCSLRKQLANLESSVNYEYIWPGVTGMLKASINELTDKLEALGPIVPLNTIDARGK